MRLKAALTVVIAFNWALLGAACSEARGGAPLGGSGMSGASMGGGGMSGASMGGGGMGGTPVGGAAGSGCTERELFTNGNFDAGGSGWTESSGKWPALIVTAEMAGGGATAQTGSYFARLGGYAEALQDDLISTVTVPASATNLVFSFYSIVASEDTSPDRHDTLFLSLDSDFQYVEHFLDNTSVHGQWQRYQKDIDPMAAGKTLIMLVRAEHDANQATTFLLDSFSLTATVCP